MQEPLVSAVVVNWNGRDVLEPCLRTLVKSSYPNLRVTVVDNASDDGSVAMVRELFPSVRVSEQATNLGFAAGVNEGLREALEEGVERAADAVACILREGLAAAMNRYNR